MDYNSIEYGDGCGPETSGPEDVEAIAFTDDLTLLIAVDLISGLESKMREAAVILKTWADET